MTVPGVPFMVVPSKPQKFDLSFSEGQPPCDSPGATALYRFFDAESRLLYVGITSRLRVRMTEHARDYAGTWWPEVDKRSVDWYPTRTDAGQAERTAIKDEQPLHNVLHTPRHRLPLSRRRRWRPSPGQGDTLLEVVLEQFDDRPFTAADLLAVGLLRKSAVDKGIRGLVERGHLVPVGTRHLVSALRGVPMVKSALYAHVGSAAAGSSQPAYEWVDITSESRPPRARTRRGAPRRRQGVNRWAPRYPDGRPAALLEDARRSFGDRPFTRPELADAAGYEVESIAKYIRALVATGDFVHAGHASKPQGSRGRAPVLLRVAVSATESVKGGAR
ncbi:GIY-YIG nuclease family protein [Streptomyces sp. NPDC015130]|uniref:GIY-YIG nuclease family protein n=1 Tax=Streptomyces sp. NPDC015130 TaxID=3364940 RepID=UPI0036FA90C9